MKTIIYNIGTLAGILPPEVKRLEGSDMNHVECINDAYLVIEDGIITEFGPQSAISNDSCHAISSDSCHFERAKRVEKSYNMLDAKGGFVMPCFCDSHTHIVYAGCRDGEFRGFSSRWCIIAPLLCDGA